MQTRKERDTMGEMDVPFDACYGAHTQRSLNNFHISNLRWNPELIKAIAIIKAACAKANNELGLIDNKKMSAIIAACTEIIDGKLDSEFPLDIFQSGSGTSTNMNVNEVIANRAFGIMAISLHPNDDVNKGQSTNDVIPSAIRIASCFAVERLIVSLSLLRKELKGKGEKFRNVLKSARTHLQDAVPITLGKEFNAYATAIGKHIERVEDTKKFLMELGIGGNAVGTGLNTYPEFRMKVIMHINEYAKLDFMSAEDCIESTQFLTDIAALSSVLKLAALDINKIANDLRLMSSGPKTGLNEITLPALEPGSSIMPGKINPSMCEAVNMACHQIIGNDACIAMSCASGNLDLNTHMPIIGHNIMESLGILSNASASLAEKCISGIKANEDICRHYVDNSMALATALSPYIGYDKATLVVKESLKSKKTIKEVVKEMKLLPDRDIERILDPERLTSPNLGLK